MRVHDDYKTWNAAVQTKDEGSVWSFWQKMLALRKKYDTLIYGTWLLRLADVR
jgi:oligo-1,6-glucosidase